MKDSSNTNIVFIEKLNINEVRLIMSLIIL